MTYELINPRDNNLTSVEQVLVNRGIKKEDIPHFLHTTDSDILSTDPIDRIQDGAKMLVKHIFNNDNILIQVDSDCDGMTSSAFLLNYLHKRFPAFVENYVQYRFHEGKQHGIIFDTVPENIKLVIAPDSSSNDYDVHRYLHDRGTDVLVIDHHQAERVSEYACVINNQLCDYPTKSLSGVGMVYKFCSYLDKFFENKIADDYLDITALGIIADVMSLRDFETKRIVEKGLANLKNPFFKSMVERNSFSIGDDLTPESVAWSIAPYVNAVLRIGTQEEKEILFESMLDYKAYEKISSTKRGCKGQLEYVVTQACRMCGNVKNRQQSLRDQYLEAVEKNIEENDLLKNKILVIQNENNSNQNSNLTGLVANQLMSKYQRPVILLSYRDDGWHGSARGYEKSKLQNFKSFCKESDLILYGEGHENAFGIGFGDEEKIKKFIEYSNEKLKNMDFSTTYKVDFIYSFGDFNGKEILDLTELKSIWGKDVEEPLIAIKDIKLNKNNLVLLSPNMHPTLKITLPNKVSLIKFKSSKEEYEQLYSENGCVIIDVIGKCNANEWAGNVTPQIIIEDYEIIAKQNYYF